MINLLVLLTSVIGILFKQSKMINYFFEKVKYLNLQCIEYTHFCYKKDTHFCYKKRHAFS